MNSLLGDCLKLVACKLPQQNYSSNSTSLKIIKTSHDIKKWYCFFLGGNFKWNGATRPEVYHDVKAIKLKR